MKEYSKSLISVANYNDLLGKLHQTKPMTKTIVEIIPSLFRLFVRLQSNNALEIVRNVICNQRISMLHTLGILKWISVCMGYHFVYSFEI